MSSTTFRTHILVCTHSKGDPEKRHCGDKAGLQVWEACRNVNKAMGLTEEVMVTKVGCTGQHAGCSADQASVIVYDGRGGTWYRARVEEVEEIFKDHVREGRLLDRLINSEIQVKHPDQ